MKATGKKELTVSISGDVAQAIQKRYPKEDYSLMVENFFKFLIIPEKKKGEILSSKLRGCATSSGLADKTDKKIKEMMHREKHGI